MEIMSKTKDMYIQLQQEMYEKMKTSDDPTHWSYCADLVQQVIDAQTASEEEARRKKSKLEISN
jgi:hypothetical protein